MYSHTHGSITASTVPSDSHVLSGSTGIWKLHFHYPGAYSLR